MGAAKEKPAWGPMERAVEPVGIETLFGLEREVEPVALETVVEGETWVESISCGERLMKIPRE